MKKKNKNPHLSTDQILDNISEGIIITDLEGKIHTVNHTFCQITGYSAKETIGKNPNFLKSGKHKPAFYKNMWKSLLEEGTWQGEICNRKKSGEYYTEWLTINAIKDAYGKTKNFIAVFNDITKRKRAEKLLHHLAYYDRLTNLPNRTLFQDRLKHALIQSQRSKLLLAVLFLDLDHVKIINDTLGHTKGDDLLKKVAQRLKSTVREADTVARLGGDEFMIILPGMDNAEAIAKIADKILESLRPPFKCGKEELYITASIGISIFPFDGKDPETLTRNADTAMYRAKKLGRNNYQIFTSSMKHEILEQLAMGNNLRRALEKGEFEVYYQPQINMETGHIIGTEALIRWNHPQFKKILPIKFIRWAEDTGLIIPLGEWVLKQACIQNSRWQAKGFPGLKVAVNISARQFKQENLEKVIQETLRDSGLDPNSLDLELTETVIMENPKNAVEVSHRLRSLGIRFSIDDFGTGYSSLNYLKTLPVDNLKIDQTFVQDLASDPNDKAIAKAVIALGHGLNLSVIAEGVETETQHDLLKAYDCDIAQGYLISRPQPAAKIENLLMEKKPLHQNTLFQGN